MSSGLTNCPSTLINVITNLFACSSDTCERLLELKTNNQPGGRLVHLHRMHLIHQLPCPEFICSRGMTHTILRRIGQSMRAKYGKRDAHGINLGINLFISVWIFDIHPPPEQDRRKGQKWRRQASLGFVLALKFQQVLIITCPSGHPFVVFLLSFFFFSWSVSQLPACQFSVGFAWRKRGAVVDARRGGRLVGCPFQVPTNQCCRYVRSTRVHLDEG